MGARLQWDMPCIFQRGSLPAALAGEREKEKAQVREERKGCSLCVGAEEGQAGPEHWMWLSLGAQQFLKCCIFPGHWDCV